MANASAAKRNVLELLRGQWELLGQITTWLLASVIGFAQEAPYTYPADSDIARSLSSFVVRVSVGLVLIPMQNFRERRHTPLWFVLTVGLLAVGLWAFWQNQAVISSCVVDYRQEKVLKGRTYTQWSREQRMKNPMTTDQDLLEVQNASRRSKIWTPESIEACHQDIQVWYIAITPIFALCTMCLLQAIRCSRPALGRQTEPRPVNGARQGSVRHAPTSGPNAESNSPLTPEVARPMQGSTTTFVQPSLRGVQKLNKMTILFLSANPHGTKPLMLDEEVREIEQKIRASDYRSSLELVSKWAVRPDDLLQYLNQYKPQVVHFSGHGSATEEIVLLDRQGDAKPVSKEALVALFRILKRDIRVVLLNACFSRPQAEAVTEEIDCAIGMQREIGDQAAIIFAASFYRAVGFGRSVQEAFDQGKAALLLEGVPEERTPILLTRKGVDAKSVFLLTP
jgi:hypothetical protein